MLLVLDGPDRFLGRSNSLVQVLSHLLSRVHGLHLLITAEGSVLSSGSGRLEASSEKVVHLGPLSDVATAHMLLNVAPPGFSLEEMMSRPYATRDEAYAELAASPVIRELRGHPKAIVMFAPLLEDHRLEELLDRAKQCYVEASQQQALSEAPSMGEEGAGAGGGATGGPDGSGGGLVGGGKGGGEGEGKELDALALERETEEAKRYLRDPGCQRLWLEVVRQGGARQSSSMHQGVPWYRLTDALQEELRKALVDALRLLRLRVQPPPEGAVGVAEEKEKGGGQGQGQEEADGGGSDVIRGLEPSDTQFVKDKLLVRLFVCCVCGLDVLPGCVWWLTRLPCPVCVPIIAAGGQARGERPGAHHGLRRLLRRVRALDGRTIKTGSWAIHPIAN